MVNTDYIAVALKAEEAENNNTQLCCCEYLDEHRQRNHLLACCCNCQNFDLAFTRLISCQEVNKQVKANMLLTFQDRLRIPWRGGAKRISMEAVIPGIVYPLVIGLAAINSVTSLIILSTCTIFLAYAHRFVKRNRIKTKFFFMWTLWSVAYMIIGFEFALPLLELLPEEHFAFIVMVCITAYFVWLTRKRSIKCYDLPSRSTEDELADISEATAAEEEAAAHTALLIDNDSPSESIQNRVSHQHQTNMCPVCRKYVSARTIHCHVCNACIMLRSHHSYWLDCCIGQYNLRYYTFSLFLGNFSILFGIYLTLTAICHPLLIWRIWNIPITMPDDCTEVFDEYTLAICFVLSFYAVIMGMYQLISIFIQLVRFARDPVYILLGDVVSGPFSTIYKKINK